MDRRAFLAAIIGSVLAAPLAAEAQQPAKVPRVGALGAIGPGWAGFRQGLRELGWEEGRNLVVEFRFAGRRDERYRELAGELVRLNVEVLAAQNSQSVRAAKEATRTIPIVMFSVSYPVEAGLVASLARPGGNVTGNSNQLSDFAGKHLELLREIAPRTCGRRAWAGAARRRSAGTGSPPGVDRCRTVIGGSGTPKEVIPG